ncbi:type II secretion system protein GspJ [Venatoribacter cucullus]|uniref:Type II secretion system protein J n=1 Tax=Venatoribacter cucullus TaxID=2661630 RepID=A0A9X7UWH5_9GAMM|nr:type II secretion system minor pseudopilin GspJ [Venatoribacter cucullus]QQD24198.1 type II secretion system protein GspJ [Venatoribacter cucullus]
MRTRGFTLLEVLVAVGITAMIGVGSAQLLANIIDSRRITDIRAEQLASLQRFNMVVSRDIEQIINRGIRDQYGDLQPALLLNNGDYLLEFTRSGWRNSPFAERPRSELQRVAYRTESLDSDVCAGARARLESWGVLDAQGECLVRYFWPVLDRASTSEPLAQVILEQVDRFEVDVLAGTAGAGDGLSTPARDKYSSWPPLQTDTTQMAPLALRWRITLPQLGDIERLWLLAWAEDV